MNIQSLSPSMVNTYRKCPRQFYYSYCLQLQRRSNAFLAFGSSFHAMAEENYFQKKETQKDLPIDLLTDFFRDDLHYRDDVDWEEQEQSLDDTKDQGVKTVRAYQEKVAPLIQPKLVEHTWNVEVKNRPWSISGKIDLIDDNDMVVDLKTTGRKLSKPRQEHVFQIGVYTMAWRMQTGKDDAQGRLDYAVRGKADTFSHQVNFGEDLGKRVLAEFDDVAKWIQREAWPGFRGHYLCSRKYCDFWDQCEKDCGGTVAH